MRAREKATLAAVEAVGSMGLALLLPLPAVSLGRYGLSGAAASLLIVVWAAAALTGAATLWFFSQRWGRKPVLVGSCLLAAEAFLALAWAGDMPMMVVARVASGFAAGNLVVAHAVRVDLSVNEPADASLLSSTVTSAVAGLALGVLLATLPWTPAVVAAWLAGGVLVAVLVTLPESASLAGDARARRREARARRGHAAPA